MSLFLEKDIVSITDYNNSLLNQIINSGDISETFIYMNTIDVDKFIKAIDDFIK